MANLTYTDSITLPSDRYQVYAATKFGRFVNIEALQSVGINPTRPNEVKDQIGDVSHRGTSLKQPIVAVPLNSLLVDATMPQLLSDKMGWVNITPADLNGTTLSGTSKVYAKVVAPILNSGVYEIRAIAQDKVSIAVSGGAVKIASLIVGAGTDAKQSSVGVLDNGIEVAITDLSGLLRAGDTAKFGVATINHWDAEVDFKLASVDMRVVVKDGIGNIHKTFYLPDMAAMNLNQSFTADGDATEAVDFETEIFQQYDGYLLKRQVVVGTAMAAAKQITFDNIFPSESGIVTPQVHKTGSPYAGKYFTRITKTSSANVDTVYTEQSGLQATAAATVKVDAPTKKLDFDALAVGDRIELTFFSMKSGSATETFNETFLDNPISVPGDYIPVSIGANAYDRATALSISTAFKRERKPYLGQTDVKYSLGKTPDITGSVSASDEDLALIRLLSKGSTTDGGVEYYVKETGDYTNMSGVNLQLVANVKSPADNTTTVVKYTIPTIVVTGFDQSISVSADTTRNFNWINKYGTMDIDRNL